MPDDPAKPDDPTQPSEHPNALKLIQDLFGESEKEAKETPAAPDPPPDGGAPADEPAPAGDAPEDKPKGKRKTKGGQAPPQPAPKVAPNVLPPESPVQPLGQSADDFYFMDAIGQLRTVPARYLGRGSIISLYNTTRAMGWLIEHFPRYNRHGLVTDIDYSLVHELLAAACGDVSRKGLFDVHRHVRGTGCWRDGAALVFHCGDEVLAYGADGSERSLEPGRHGRYAYPLGERQIRPSLKGERYARAGELGAGMALLRLYQRWRWARPVDPLLLLGWTVAAQVGGALDWRPAVWVTGEAATGKSTLLKVIAGAVGGPGAAIDAGNATAASLWQTFKNRSLPVLLDEVEAGRNNERYDAVVEVMRVNSSGGVLRRGASDHKAVEFSLYSAFLFSSINVVPLLPQVMSRLAILELLPLAKSASRPEFAEPALMEVASALRRRFIDAQRLWPDHLMAWWHPLNEAFKRRTADTYGTLLALAHLAVADELPHSDWVDEVLTPLTSSLRESQEVAGRDFEGMLNALGTFSIDPFGHGRKHTIASLTWWASNEPDKTDYAGAEKQREVRRFFGEELARERARDGLRQVGLAVVQPRDDGDAQYLAVAFRARGLSAIFKDTIWQGGTWRSAAARIPGAKTRKVRISGASEGAVLVPLRAFLGEFGGPEPPAPAVEPEPMP